MILRDTGANQSLLLEGSLPVTRGQRTERHIPEDLDDNTETKDDADLLNLSDTFMSHDIDVIDLHNEDCTAFSVLQGEQAREVYTARNNLIALQEKDPSLS